MGAERPRCLIKQHRMSDYIKVKLGSDPKVSRESRSCLRLGEERRMVAGDPLVDLHDGGD